MAEVNKPSTDYKQRAWAAFVEGERFLSAVQILEKYDQMTVPLIVNSVFMCELFLKCILYLENETTKTIKEHKLRELFEGLKESSKNTIINKAEIINLDKFWEETSEAFVNWRYFYEKIGLISTNFDEIMCFAIATRKLAKEELYGRESHQ